MSVAADEFWTAVATGVCGCAIAVPFPAGLPQDVLGIRSVAGSESRPLLLFGCGAIGVSICFDSCLIDGCDVAGRQDIFCGISVYQY